MSGEQTADLVAGISAMMTCSIIRLVVSAVS